MIAVKCPHCGSVQKVDENKYEVACRKCKETMNVEEALDLLNSGASVPAASGTEELDFDTAMERGRKMLDAGDYGIARSFLERALALNAESAEANWAMCRTVLCAADIAPTRAEVLYAKGEREEAVAIVAAEQHCAEAKAEYLLRKSLSRMAKYTDTESDDYCAEALEYAEEPLRSEIEDKYAVYSFCTPEGVQEETLSAAGIGAYSDIAPNFGRRRPVIGWRLILSLLIGLGLTAVGIALIVCDSGGGWSVTMLVLGLLVSMFSSVVLVFDSRRCQIRKLLETYRIEDIGELAQVLYLCKTEQELAGAVSRCILNISSMIAMGQLTYIGLSGGKTIQYYDESCNLIRIVREEDRDDRPAAIAEPNENEDKIAESEPNDVVSD